MNTQFDFDILTTSEQINHITICAFIAEGNSRSLDASSRQNVIGKKIKFHCITTTIKLYSHTIYDKNSNPKNVNLRF